VFFAENTAFYIVAYKTFNTGKWPVSKQFVIFIAGYFFSWLNFVAAAMIWEAVNPYFSSNWAGVPLSPNVSLVPTYTMDMGRCLAAVCAILLIGKTLCLAAFSF
jgi:hypothetical protein